MLKPEHFNLQHLYVLDADPEIDVKSSKKSSFLRLVPCALEVPLDSHAVTSMP